MYLLDTDVLTDVLIDIQRGHPPAVAWFQSLDLPAISSWVVMELIQSAQNSQQVRVAMKLISPLSVVWPTEVECNKAPSDFKTYHLSHGLGLIDSLIAACAVGMSAELCTFNIKHYKSVPGTTNPFRG